MSSRSVTWLDPFVAACMTSQSPGPSSADVSLSHSAILLQIDLQAQLARHLCVLLPHA
jgi:hypothetical protein